MANLERFIFNSDYPMDKIVFYGYGSTTIPAKSGSTNGTKTINIPHHLLFTPLPLAVCATNEAFTDTRTFEPVPDTWGMNLVQADATNITIKFENGQTSTKTVYYRVYGLLPENATQEVGKNSRQSSKLIFNTDLVYAPLIFSGIVTEDLDTTHVANVNVTHGYKEIQTQASRIEIEHNLGRSPFVLYWRETSGTISITGFPDMYYGYPYQQYNYSDDKKCNFYTGQSDGQNKWHIRIYANV